MRTPLRAVINRETRYCLGTIETRASSAGQLDAQLDCFRQLGKGQWERLDDLFTVKTWFELVLRRLLKSRRLQ